MGNLGSTTDILYFNKVMSSTMHWPYLGVIIVQKIPSESLQYNSTTVFMTCNEMAATVSCRHGSHTQVSTLPYPPTGQSQCISMVKTRYICCLDRELCIDNGESKILGFRNMNPGVSLPVVFLTGLLYMQRTPSQNWYQSHFSDE